MFQVLPLLNSGQMTLYPNHALNVNSIKKIHTTSVPNSLMLTVHAIIEDDHNKNKIVILVQHIYWL